MGKKRTSLFIRCYEESGAWSNSKLPLSLLKRLREEEDAITRNLKLIEFKEVETYIDYEELSFSREKVEEGNTLVLENSGVFN